MQDEAKRYGEVLQAALTEINGSQSKPKVREHMEELVKISKGLNKSFADKHAECKDYLTKALDQADKLPEMTLDQIEKGYHADAALPKAPGLCHHAKDLLVHPATVLIHLKSEGSKVMTSALAELTELSTHLAVVQAKLK
jgi:hypothetical protein